MQKQITLRTKQRVLADIQRQLLRLLHIALGDPEEPRVTRETEYLSEAVTRVIDSQVSLQSLKQMKEKLRSLSQDVAMAVKAMNILYSRFAKAAMR